MRRIRVPRHLAISLGAMLFISCSNPEWVCGCSPAEPVALLSGRVTGPDGAGVAGAEVHARIGRPGCTEPFQSGRAAVTREDGSYRAYIHGGYTVQAPGDCVFVHAEPGDQGSLRMSDTTRVDVLFVTGEQPDSVQVDLVLRGPE